MSWAWPWRRRKAAAVDESVVDDAIDARVQSERKLAETRRTIGRVDRMIDAHKEIRRVDGLPNALAEALRRRTT